MLRYDGKVVLVTGAANGLGREYALAFGARGATVIVNDLGGSHDGEGSSTRPADLVVEQIIKEGGKAIANYESVEEGEKIVNFIIEKFGRIDVLVHNAGIIRDKSLAKMKDFDWDLVHRIHLRSVFVITRAAWPHMTRQKSGKIITISSSAGVYGNFGQCNYSAAKMGVYAFSQCIALEGKKYNIKANCVVPIAGSRLTRFLMPDDMADALKARYVAPLILWLCHDECQETGGLFECGAGWMVRWERTDGQVLRRQNDEMSVEDVKDNWPKICDFSKSHHPINIHDANARYFGIIDRFSKRREEGVVAVDDVFNYSPKDLTLYALGVGVKASQPGSLRYLYEASPSFEHLPTFSIVPSFPVLSSLTQAVTINGKNIDYSRLLHGEQCTHVFKTLPTSGRLKVSGEVVDVVDKGSAALVVVNIHLFSETDEKLAMNQSVLFVKGAGGYGGPSTCQSIVPVQPVPARAPDFSVQEKTFEDQAALYRLSGDYNPLHVDPEFSSLMGFKTPILHGLCTYAIACRHVVSHYCPQQPSLVKAVKARFSCEVIPGQTIETGMWKEGKRIHFESKVLETGKVCLSAGYVDLSSDVDAPAQQPLQSKL